MGSISLSVYEIVFLFFCAVIVGVVIHFFITSRRHLKKSLAETNTGSKSLNEWKLKYLNDMEVKEKEMSELKERYEDAEENNRINTIEIEELRKQIDKLKISKVENSKQEEHKPDYVEQLRQAQQSLLEHNQKISKLLEQVDVIKESEEKNKEILKNNEELSLQIKDLNYLLKEKEDEINQIRQKEHISKEVASMLDSAYNEFNVLQGKMQKLESQLASSKMVGVEYEDLKESYYKMSREYEETKNRLNHYMKENQNLQIQVARTEEKLSEANLQRQQLQKKVTYLEELTNDLQQMSEANKKLESQLRRIGELESMLDIVSEERDKLKDKQDD